MKNKFGLIGLGSMGSMIINQVVEQGIYDEKDIYVAELSGDKLAKLKCKYNSINICDNKEVVQNCSNVMICVLPAIVPRVLSEIVPYVKEEINIMISTAVVSYRDLYKIYPGGITKFMPTLNSTVRGGVTLVCYNEQVPEENKKYFAELMSYMSEVVEIREEDMNLCHNLNGSFPAYISELMLEFVKSAYSRSAGVSFDKIERIVALSLEGSSRLFKEKNMKFEDMKNTVSTKGSITYEGIKVYEDVLPDMFDKAFDAAMKKYSYMSEEVSESIEFSIK